MGPDQVASLDQSWAAQNAQQRPIHMGTPGEQPEATKGLAQTMENPLLKGTASHQDSWRSDLGVLSAMQPGNHSLDSHFLFRNNWGAEFIHSLEFFFGALPDHFAVVHLIIAMMSEIEATKIFLYGKQFPQLWKMSKKGR